MTTPLKKNSVTSTKWRDHTYYHISSCLGLLSILFMLMDACTTRLPHDIGEYNYLKTICHVWKDHNGFRAQDTQYVNSNTKLHRYHPWDYDGECSDE